VVPEQVLRLGHLGGNLTCQVLEAYGKGMGKKWADIERRLKDGESRFFPPPEMLVDPLVSLLGLVSDPGSDEDRSLRASAHARSEARYDRMTCTLGPRHGSPDLLEKLSIHEARSIGKLCFRSRAQDQKKLCVTILIYCA